MCLCYVSNFYIWFKAKNIKIFLKAIKTKNIEFEYFSKFSAKLNVNKVHSFIEVKINHIQLRVKRCHGNVGSG